jgi:ketosteroid isomerase-like protein
MSDQKDVVRRFFATLSTGDLAAIGEFFTDETIWQVNDVARGIPTQRGRNAIISDFFRPIREGLFEPGDPKISIRRLIADGDWVVAEATAFGRLLNGKQYINEYVFVMQVVGDKIRYVREYLDSDYAHAISADAAGATGAEGHVAETLEASGHD